MRTPSNSVGWVLSEALKQCRIEQLMSGYFIRPIVPIDEPFLWEMLYHALYVPPGHAPLPREIVREPELARYVAGWGREGDEGFVAVDGVTSASVGAVWLRLFSAEEKGYGYVDAATSELSIALLPAYRNRGIGTELLCQSFAAARGRYPALSLSVSTDNPALRLYQRLGFELVEQQGNSVTMRKMLRE